MMSVDWFDLSCSSEMVSANRADSWRSSVAIRFISRWDAFSRCFRIYSEAQMVSTRPIRNMQAWLQYVYVPSSSPRSIAFWITVADIPVMSARFFTPYTSSERSQLFSAATLSRVRRCCSDRPDSLMSIVFLRTVLLTDRGP